MKIIRRIIFILPVIILLQGCVVFEPVGSFFAQGYRNTVAYFNTFYNAKRIYSEAEDEYLKAFRLHEQASRDGVTTPFRVPPATAQKFNTVIDKCSNILTFQSESDYVEDALFLVARSYDYLGETVKAERKYAEMLAQFPRSDHRIEGVARLGGVLFLQGRMDEALILLEQAEQEAVEREDDDILPFILERLAVLHRDAGEFDKAHVYYARLDALSSDNEELVSALIDYARLQLEIGRPDEALQIARNVGELTDDQFYAFDARATEVEALRQLGKQEEALQRLDESFDDVRFLLQQASVRLLRADVLLEMGEDQRAIDEYRYIDTTFARRSHAASAAFALGKYFTSKGEYTVARAAFERASGVATAPITAEARKWAQHVTRYIGLQARYWQTDSVMSALHDSVETLPDPRIDSMETLRAAIMQDMGDWHYADGYAPDSAYDWLSKSVESGKVRPEQSRALFILADIASADTGAGYGDPSVFYRRIATDFPASIYADEARSRLGILAEQGEDPGYDLYRAAERELDRGKPTRAVGMFDSLGQKYPESSYALQGIFAAGWIYEYYLAQHDSASVRYNEVVRSGTTESFVQEARTRLAKIKKSGSDSLTIPVAPTDTTRTASPSLPRRLNDENKQGTPDSTRKIIQ